MKPIILINLILLTLSVTANAQVFSPGAEWYYCQHGEPFANDRCSIFKLNQVSEETQDTFLGTFNTYFGKLIVKQYGKKVWFNDILNYDFELSQGDTIRIRYDFGDIEKYQIDSTNVEYIFGRDRIVQFISLNNRQKIMVEGLGTAGFLEGRNLESLDYFFDSGIIEVNYRGDPSLRFSQFKDEEIHIVPDQFKTCYACDQLLPVKEDSRTEPSYKMHLSNDILTISGLNSPSVLQLFNTSAQILKNIKSKEAEVEVDISNLVAGIYFLKIINMDNGKASSLKFVKEH